MHLLVEGFKIIHQNSEITIDDLKNEEFIAELIECELISEEDRR
jgi:hypothetical protein